MIKKKHTTAFILNNTVFSLSNIGVSVINKTKSSVVMSLPSYRSVYLQKKDYGFCGWCGGFSFN